VNKYYKLIVLFGLFLACLQAVNAQINLGSEVSLNGSGSLSAGYSADYGNAVSSDHSLELGGQGTFNGYYYDPNLLSFSLVPYANQSRANSDFQSVTDASGLNLNTSMFSGTHFPANFSYAYARDSENNYGLPGLSSYASHGDSNSFGVGWSALLPGLPTLNIGYDQSKSNYELYGADQPGSSDTHLVFLNSVYAIDGFHLSGGYKYQTQSSYLPQIFQGVLNGTSDNHTGAYDVAVDHALPWHGTAFTNFSHNTFGENFSDTSTSGSYDTVNSGVTLSPTERLQLSTSYGWNDNLLGALTEQVINTNGETVFTNVPGESSTSQVISSSMIYRLFKGFSVGATGSYAVQGFLGNSYSSEAYSGNANYVTNLLGGTASEHLSVSKTLTNVSNYQTLGWQTASTWSRDIGGWGVNANYSYSRNQQTVLLAYSSSGYSASGSVNHRFGRIRWSGSASYQQDGVDQEANSTTKSMAYSMAAGGRYLSVSGGYSRVNGNSILTALGLTSTTVPQPIINPASLVSIGGDSYTAGVGLNPFRNLSINSAYYHTANNSVADGALSFGKSEELSTYLQYRFRKLYISAGYTKLSQGFSSTGVPAGSLSSYYFGIQRWFNLF
jgi:hypothetical protein